MAAVRGGHVWFQSVWPLREMSVWFHCVSFRWARLVSQGVAISRDERLDSLRLMSI